MAKLGKCTADSVRAVTVSMCSSAPQTGSMLASLVQQSYPKLRALPRHAHHLARAYHNGQRSFDPSSGL